MPRRDFFLRDAVRAAPQRHGQADLGLRAQRPAAEAPHPSVGRVRHLGFGILHVVGRVRLVGLLAVPGTRLPRRVPYQSPRTELSGLVRAESGKPAHGRTPHDT
ncbi:hypothetical protein [Streptomyces sp. CB02400]|uniref:hypothetical protein n=1 Tax=Streptomyces sp. CB02400 TaxID=1703944 RepID=UPI00093F39D7|nr:hypothetical protein [Streptomyces sp. CB02400]OKK14081.1 hypothetical protein AMK33_04620 [Streptomyces sp. CB02400]